MKNIIILIIFLIFIIVGFVFHHFYTFIYITAQFSELRPIHTKLPVYYKGIIVGKAKELRHSNTFEHTLMRIVLFPKNLKLPKNIKIILKKEKRNNVERDFLEFLYPKEPAKIYLTNHDVIEGLLAHDAQDFLSNQHGDDLETIKENLVESSENLNYALQGLGQMFEIANEILKDNRQNIYKTTKNVQDMTVKINGAVKQQQMENSFSNIENSLSNVAQMIYAINQATPKIDSGLNEIEESLCDINKITCGLKKTLSKNFGVLRLFFGKIIE